MFTALLGALVTLVTQGGSAAIEDIKEARANQREVEKAEAENKARLLRDQQTNNHEWEMANLTDKDKWLRRVSFLMFSGPFFWALYDSEGVKNYFNVALAAMPEWYIQTFIGITGAIWGIAQLKNAVPALISGVVKAVKE